jgi:photosystem II stability/assembly factor-like uncharacterized protein
MGNLWKDGGERGLYKTTDAGKTWKLILHAAPPDDARAGCGDVALDPSNPEIVYRGALRAATHAVVVCLWRDRNQRPGCRGRL